MLPHLLPKAIGLGDGTFQSGSNCNRLYLHPGSLYPKQYTTFFRRRILVNIFTENTHHTPAKMSRGTNSILSEIEWDEGLSMPVANAENKVLEDQVKLKCRDCNVDHPRNTKNFYYYKISLFYLCFYYLYKNSPYESFYLRFIISLQ